MCTLFAKQSEHTFQNDLFERAQIAMSRPGAHREHQCTSSTADDCDKQKYDRQCFNQRPSGKYDQRVKEMEAQLRDKSKRDTDEETDHAESAPPSQKLCFNLEQNIVKPEGKGPVNRFCL